MELVAAAAEHRGIQLRTCTNEFIKTYIKSVSLFTDFSGTIPIKIIDLNQNKTLDTVNLTSVANEISTVVIEKEYESPVNLAVVYDATSIGSYKVSFGCNTCAKWVRTSKFLEASSIKLTSPFIENNATNTTYTGGMILTYNINCDYDAWMCSFKGLLGMPFLYKVAAEIKRYQHRTKRYNDDTLEDVQNDIDYMR